jgi:hypothetical protein
MEIITVTEKETVTINDKTVVIRFNFRNISNFAIIKINERLH